MQRMKPILFTRGVPAIESFPAKEMAEAAAAALEQHGPALLQYGPSTGLPFLREWIAEWKGVEPAQVLTGNGSLQLLEFLCLVLLRPGDVVVTESPTYDRTLTLLRRHGASPVGVPLEVDGPNVDEFERTVRARAPRFVYLIPDFQNPSGATCAGAKRRRIAALAEELGLLLVEDAPYRPLRYRGHEEPTLFDLAPGRTLHMSSFSKLIGPGPRLGFMLGAPELIGRLARAAEDTYISPSNLAHGIAYEWCRRGRLPGQIERLKALYAPRLDACLSALARHMPEAEATRPDGGFFLSVTLPKGIDNAAVRVAAEGRQLQLADGRAFFPDGGGERFLRLPYCALTPEEIEEGVRRLADSVHDLERIGSAELASR
jgi:DNA-binding transcriptional MocR family regulator